MKFRQKPIVIEAVQWNGQNSLEVKTFAGRDIRVVHNTLCVGRIDIHIGDWLVKDTDGLRVCSNEAFENAYKPLKSEPKQATTE